MPIAKAVGLGIAILVLKTLAPAVFIQLQSTVITVLRTGEQSASAISSFSTSSAGDFWTKPHFALPQAPGIVKSP